MFTRDDTLDMVNQSGLISHMTDVQKTILATMEKMIPVANQKSNAPEKTREELLKDADTQLLTHVGPAAASAGVEYALHHCRKMNQFRNVRFTSNHIQNTNLVHNDPGGSSDFSNTLRQFLLPRYAYLDFDQIVDPRHKIDAECGYPKFITPIMYRYMYDRDDIARRVVDVYPNESWGVDPCVYENEDEEAENTAFEQDWEDICEDHNLISVMYRADRLCGIGHYGVILYGFDDGKELDQPVDEPELLAGLKRTVGKKQRKLLYVRPFDEYLSFIIEYETNTNSPRCGLPIMYNLVFVDMTIDAAGSSIGTRVNRRVHWTRVAHIADNLVSGRVMGIPRQQPIFNRELDLRKLKGGGAEMFWKGAFPGISFEMDPKFVADSPNFDVDAAKEDVAAYFNGLQRSLFLQGVSAKTLAPQIAENPEKYVDIQIKAISSSLEMPLPVFMGWEEAKLASVQNVQIWNKRLARRLRLFASPEIIRNVIDRLIAVGCMRPPAKKYFVEWPDLNSPTDEDKANLSLKWTQALSQYVSSGMIHLIRPMDYLTMILGLRPSQARKIILETESKNGGWSKLIAVDPSQGSGQNGKRTDIDPTKGVTS